MNNPKISVIIPTYNRSNLIKNTIMGVVNQTYTDWELLVVDDGSTDNTREIVAELTKKDSRIKYFYQENSGCPSGPRNKGVEKAKGVYVAFLDSDDEWFPTKLEKQIVVFENSNNPKLGVVACYLYIKDYKTGEIISEYNKFYKGDVLDKLIINNFPFTSSCIMTKLSILKEAGPFDPIFKVSEDVDMWLRISELGYEFDYIPEYLLNYLVHDSNIYYGNKNFDGENEFIVLITKHKDLYLKQDSSILGYYYYFVTKEYKLARKYLIRRLFEKTLPNREKVKAFGYIIITLFPFLKNFSKLIWKNIRNSFKS
jgi:glycosyltransferase involved in cell wall biosynthesis